MKSFVLDIETDSTIVADEQAEKQGRTEFMGMLAQLLPQLAQMMSAEPRTAKVCGELLKFSVAPFRAGRALDGAIDDLSALMEEKAGEPQGDDPTTAQNKTAIQIEQMKLQAQKESDAAKMKVEQDKMAMQDQHKQQELQAQKDIKAMELSAKQGDNAAKEQVQAQKLQENRESHQADMVKSDMDMRMAQQKNDLAIQQHSMRADDMRQKQVERQQAAAFKQQTQQGLIP
jgi:hypothetical protein